MRALLSKIKIFLLLMVIFSCSDNHSDDFEAKEINLDDSLNYEGLLDGINLDLLTQTVEPVDSDGALSRNKEGYFSVRFQINITKLSDLAIVAKRVDALNQYIMALNYSFNYQNQDGSYQLSPPENLLSDPSVNLPTQGDSVSAVAFFGYALGISLNSLTEADWYETSDQTKSLRKEIENFTPQMSKTLNYLVINQSILRQIDAEAPNRLLFDAVAFYGLGKYLGDSDAKDLGMEFLQLALNQTDKEQGYFIEGGGWDSSYNGVALKLGFEIFTMLPAGTQLKNDLERILVNAAIWQAARISSDGEVSTEGNTRVYSGGESFLGTEKEVDAEKTVRAFYYLSKLSGDKTFKALGDRVLSYYNQ